MKSALFARLFNHPKAKSHGRARLAYDSWPAAVYAIGDVHGCLGALKRLEDAIAADGEQFPGEKWIICLGDYVDRGPDSAGVIDHLLAPAPTGFNRICLAGNHEVMMLDFLSNGTGTSFAWLENGGRETLKSYGLDADQFGHAPRHAQMSMLDSAIPTEHRDFLKGCALALTLPRATFVHAGLKPGVPMDRQKEDDLLWIRHEFLEANWPDDELIVHGHTPAELPRIGRGRLGIDTGAFSTGQLTAARLTASLQPHLITVSSG